MRMQTATKLLAIFLLSPFELGCGDDDDDGTTDDGAGDDGSDDGGAVVCSVTPAAWSAPDFAANAAGPLALRTQLDALGTLMRGAELETMTVDDIGDLTAIYEEGDPSLSGAVTDAFAPIVDDAFADFVALSLAGVQDLIDDTSSWAPGASGGIFGEDSRGFNAGGLEVRQLVDKGLFGGAAFYQHALSLTEGAISEATIDALAAAWGSNENLGTDEPTDSANYSFDMGFHSSMAEDLASAKAFAADDSCTEERDEALVSFFRTWEQSLVARTVYYGNATASALAVAVADNEKANALHELAEGIGLTIGFLGLLDPAAGPLSGSARLLTDADIEEIATAFGVVLADLSASTTGDFVEDPASIQAAVETVEAKVIEVFDLTADDIASYRTPTEG